MANLRYNGKNRSSNRPVQDRLLDAAEELFCERGFDGASVRDIAAAAGCNIASANYYFGGKEKLYIEVWHRLLVRMRDIRLGSIQQVMSRNGGKPSLEELLRSFANAFIEPLVDESRALRLIKLMAREMLDQHLPPNMFVEEIIIPTMTAMQKALVKTCPNLEESKVPLLIFSIVAQLIHAVRIRTMFEQTDNTKVPALDLTEAVNHIVEFYADGIRAYTEQKTK